MKWTKAQSDAINIPVSDIIVSAAAGSGKTAVMAERIISRLTCDDYVDIDKILVVTYTNAAASEIKERVMKKIVERLSETDNDILQKQLILIENSHFCTIHSFCLELIKKYFYILGIDPMVKTGDQTDLDILLNEAVSKVTDDYLAKGDRDYLSLIKAYGNGKEVHLENIILDIYKFSRTMPDSEKWLLSLNDLYDEYAYKPQKYILSTALLALEYAHCEINKAYNLIEKTGCCAKWQENIFHERNMIEKALSSTFDYKTIYESIISISFDRLPASKDVSDEFIKAEIKNFRDSAKKTVSEICEKFLCISPEDIPADNSNVCRYLSKLVEAVIKTGDIYDGLKRKKNLIDFSDYEHFVLKLLRNDDGTPSDIAFEISNNFKEIYIDEFQDCNNIQNEIFNLISGSICGTPNIFCVGDMKQSIYKFRDANPLNFKNRCDDAVQYDGNDVYPSNKIYLNSNFRSRSTVLDFVNSVFSQLMSNQCGEIVYDDDEALNYGGGYVDVNPDVSYIDIDIINESNDFGDAPDSATQSQMSKIDAEVTHIANRIKEITSNDYMLYDKKQGITKKADYSDIAVLFRSPSSYLSAIEQIFTKYKIPYYCDNGGNYLDTEEIDFLLSFMKIIDNPDDDIALASVMKNPLIGFDENMLLRIRVAAGRGSYYKCVFRYIKTHDDFLSKKLSEFLDFVEALYLDSRYMGTAEFLMHLIERTKYNVYLSSFADSNIRKTNVRFLINKAREFENNNFKGIYSFIRYVDNIKQSDSVQSAAAASDSNNVVRVMSIHKSKGLEFPIVFLGGTGKKYNMSDVNSRHVVHKDYGVGLDSVYLDSVYRVPTVNKLAIKQKIKFEAMSEELRVLYVALTRPTEKIIITGTVKNGASFLNSIERTLKNQKYNINPYIVSRSKCFLETILLSAMRSHGFEGASDAGYEVDIADNVMYNLTLKNLSDIAGDSVCKENADWKDFFKAKTDNYDSFVSGITYEYPFMSASTIPGNVTVTEIKRLSSKEDDGTNIYADIELARPSNFAQKEKIKGNVLGTLMHLCMERMNLSLISDANYVYNQIELIAQSGVISNEEKDAIDVNKIISFGKSSICKRMSENVHTLQKEFSFKHFIKSSEFYDVDSDEQIIVQGTIDAFFEDDDGNLVLIDYKTDKVKNGDFQSVVEKYRIQLDCYSKALEKIYGKKVKEKIIYLFDTEQAITL